MKDFKKSESWVKRGDHYTVEVKRWESPMGNHWNVYANIFPDHPIYEDLEAQEELPLHWGLSYWVRKSFADVKRFDWTRDAETITIGSDYAHLYDERFERFSTPEEAHEVFNDAEELFLALNQRRGKNDN
jgi:hypothetical protein